MFCTALHSLLFAKQQQYRTSTSRVVEVTRRALCALPGPVVVQTRALPVHRVAHLRSGPDVGTLAGAAVRVVEVPWLAPVAPVAAEAFATQAGAVVLGADLLLSALRVAVAIWRAKRRDVKFVHKKC